MKSKKALMALSLVTVLLTGCKGKKTYEAKEYLCSLPWNIAEDYKILQLSDIHLSQSDVHEEHFAVIDKTVKEAKPNLIVLNGDVFTFADKHVVRKVFSHIDSLNIPWTFTFGNHDDQGYYGDDYIQRLLGGRTYTHVVFKNIEDDDVTGRSNFVINLYKQNADKKLEGVIYQVYLLDSHNYNFDTLEYDYIKQDQIDWYERVVKYSTQKYSDGENPVPSSMYMHIGMPEFISSWDQSKPTSEQEGLIIGDMQEFNGSPSEDPGFFNKIKELGSTRSIHVAHDHANDSVLKYKDIYLCFGVHSTNRIYNDDDSVKIGGQLLTINKDTRKLTFTNLYASYNSSEVKNVTGGEE